MAAPSGIVQEATSLALARTKLYTTSIAGSSTVPPLPTVTEHIDVEKYPSPICLPLCCAGMYSSSGLNFLRCLASATAILVKCQENPTGSSAAMAATQKIDPSNKNRVLPEEDGSYLCNGVKISQDVYVMFATADLAECGAYVGMTYLGLSKTATSQNMEAFNQKRVSAVKARVSGDLKLFVPQSKAITTSYVQMCNASGVAYPNIVGRLVECVARHAGNLEDATSRGFSTIFQLLEGQGYTALEIIQEGLKRYPWVVEKIPELTPDVAGFVSAVKSIQAAPAHIQGLLKVIHQERYVPMPPGSPLAAYYHELLRTEIPTLENYQGSKATAAQVVRLATVKASLDTLSG